MCDFRHSESLVSYVKWVNKLRYTHTRSYCGATKKNELLIHVMSWVNIKITVLSKRSQAQKGYVQCDFIFMKCWTKLLWKIRTVIASEEVGIDWKAAQGNFGGDENGKCSITWWRYTCLSKLIKARCLCISPNGNFMTRPPFLPEKNSKQITEF